MKVTYLQQILLPSVSRFLSDEVMVVVSTRSNPLVNPAVTFCPYNETKYKLFLTLISRQTPVVWGWAIYILYIFIYNIIASDGEDSHFHGRYSINSVVRRIWRVRRSPVSPSSNFPLTVQMLLTVSGRTRTPSTPACKRSWVIPTPPIGPATWPQYF